jgi:signal transduction histidine kinase
MSMVLELADETGGLIDAIDDCALVIDDRGTVLEAGAQAQGLFGYPGRDLVGCSLDVLFPGEGLPRIAGTPTVRRAMGRHRDGCEIAVELRINPFGRDRSRRFLVIVRNARQLADNERRDAAMLRTLQGFLQPARLADLAALDDSFAQILRELLDLTGSENGFLADYRSRADGSQYLRMLATADHAPRPDRGTAGAHRFRDIDVAPDESALAAAVRAANAAAEEATGPAPSEDGGQPLANFVVLPVLAGNLLVGMALLANRPGGYDRAVLDLLSPLLQSIGYCIHTAQAFASERAVQEQLAGATQKAEARNRNLDQFIARMTHELGSPLNAILGFSGMITAMKPSLERTEDYARSINDAGRHLQGLLEDIRAFGRTDDRAGQDRAEAFDLRVAVEEAVRLAKGTQYRKPLDIAAVPQVKVTGNRQRLLQVLMNLTSNALKYTPADGRVSIRISLGPDGFVLHVRDNGFGIPKARIGELFTPFRRFHARADIAGTGLGLTIVKALVDAMGGAVTIRSIESVGTCVRVTLPLLKAG